jgi:hypothetical protein
LIKKLLDFTKHGKCHSLKNYESLVGHMNWLFTVFLLLKPSLSVVYQKISGKTLSLTPICVNNAIIFKLEWFTKHAHASNGIFLLETVAWDPTTELVNTTVCFADACLGGMAFWYPKLQLGYQCHIPQGFTAPIFYWEAVMVVCAMIAPPLNQSQ